MSFINIKDFLRLPLSLRERAKGEGRCSLIPTPSPGGRRERAERASRDPLHVGRRERAERAARDPLHLGRGEVGKHLHVDRARGEGNFRVALLVVLAAVLVGCAGIQRATTPGAKTVTSEPVVDPQWRRAYEHALGLMVVDKLSEAERELTALAERQPTLAGPYANLGILYFRAGRTADAVKVLEHAIALNPRPAYYNELGRVRRTEGRFDAAEQAYRRALELDPDYAYAHLNLGILYDLYLQQPDRALPHYERYRALAPGEAGTVEKWIADLKRRTSQAADRNKGERNG